MNYRKKALEGLAILLAGVVATRTVQVVTDENAYYRTRSKVQLAIDVDKNRLFTEEEWMPVYKYLGLTPTNREGLDLSTEQLRSYLESGRQ